MFSLEALQERPEDELFFVFADRTNGKETYGGGRFLYARAPDERGRVVLDFNRAYNPPCAFTPYSTCPLPPPENRLDLEVRAGEKRYRGREDALSVLETGLALLRKARVPSRMSSLAATTPKAQAS